jgi:transcription elongation GreA/GreB family factor
MTLPDKTAVAGKIISCLRAELDGFTRAAKQAQEAATDPDSKAENKYDTRNLEASYLARGVAFRVAETEAALSAWQAMPPQDFSAMRPVAVGALVLINDAQGRSGFFIGPGGGGISVEHEGMDITVITADSPLGKQLLKRREGDVFLLESGPRRTQTVIETVL